MESIFMLKLSTIAEEITNFLSATLNKPHGIPGIDKNICILFDADGVLYDAERYSHYASVDVLIKYNRNIAEEIEALREDLSDLLVGVKVVNQMPIIKKFYQDNKLDVNYPENFDKLRDARQDELFETLEPIEGVIELLNLLEENNISFALVSRSRYEPMIKKIKQTGLDRYFTEANTFNSFNEDLVYEYAKKFQLDLSMLNFDKTSLFIHAAAMMGHQPQKCIGIEDTAKGVKSIINAGMTAICFNGASSTNKQALADALASNGSKPIVCSTMI
jgi:beta-phosphoglucomutase-like phosphatase (HAD superfamily)